MEYRSNNTEGMQLFSPRYSDVPSGYYSTTTEMQLGRNITPIPSSDAYLNYLSKTYLSDSTGVSPSTNHSTNGNSSFRMTNQSSSQTNYTSPITQNMNTYSSRSATNFQLKTSAYPSPAPSLRSVISESASSLPPEQLRLSIHRKSFSSQKPRPNGLVPEQAMSPATPTPLIPMNKNLTFDSGSPISPLPYSSRTTSDNEAPHRPFPSLNGGAYSPHSPQLTSSENPTRVPLYAPRPLPKLPPASTPSSTPSNGSAISSPSTPLTIQHMLSKRFQQPTAVAASQSPIMIQYGPLRTCTAEGILNSFAGVRSPLPQPSTSSSTPSSSSPSIYASAQRAAASASAFSFSPSPNVQSNSSNQSEATETSSRPPSSARGSGAEHLSADSPAASAASMRARSPVPPPLPPHNIRPLTPRAFESIAPEADASASNSRITSPLPLASASAPFVPAVMSAPSRKSSRGASSGKLVSVDREGLATRVEQLEHENAELRTTMDANEVAMMRMFDARKRQWIAEAETMRDEYELRLQSANAALCELQCKQRSSAAPQAVASSPDAPPLLQSPESQSLSSILSSAGSLPQSTRNSLASVRSVPTTAPEKAMLELRTENERLQALVEYLRLQIALSNSVPAPPLATSSPTSKVHVKNTSEVRERSVSVNVVLETADSRASPRPEAVAVGERVRAHNGDLHVVRLASDSSAAATASSSASVSVSRLEQLSARVSYLEAELASRQRKFDDERATWLLEKDKVLEFQKRLQQNYVQTRDRCSRLELELERLRGHRASAESPLAASQSLTSFAVLPLTRSISPAPASADDMGSTLTATLGSVEGVAHRSFTSPDVAELVLVAGAESSCASPERGPPPPPRNGHFGSSASYATMLDVPRPTARKSSRSSSGDELDVPINSSSQLQMQSHAHSFALPLALDITTSSC